MPRTARLTLIGIENGARRTLVYRDGKLTGDQVLQDRFWGLWHIHEDENRPNKPPSGLEKLLGPDHWRAGFARKILKELLPEVIELRAQHLETEASLRRKARKAVGWFRSLEPKLQQLREEDERSAFREYLWPADSWDEVMAGHERGGWKPMGDPPEEHPKCSNCLKPTEWSWYCSNEESWKYLAGRAGWIAVCRPCKFWRPIVVRMMN